MAHTEHPSPSSSRQVPGSHSRAGTSHSLALLWALPHPYCSPPTLGHSAGRGQSLYIAAGKHSEAFTIKIHNLSHNGLGLRAGRQEGWLLPPYLSQGVDMGVAPSSPKAQATSPVWLQGAGGGGSSGPGVPHLQQVGGPLGDTLPVEARAAYWEKIELPDVPKKWGPGSGDGEQREPPHTQTTHGGLSLSHRFSPRGPSSSARTQSNRKIKNYPRQRT